MTDIAGGLPFWCSILGFAVIADASSDEAVRLQRADGAGLILAVRGEPEEATATGQTVDSGVTLQLYVPDLAPILKALAKHGWPLIDGPRIARCSDLGGALLAHQVHVRDPAGHLVLIAQLIGDRNTLRQSREAAESPRAALGRLTALRGFRDRSVRAAGPGMT